MPSLGVRDCTSSKVIWIVDNDIINIIYGSGWLITEHYNLINLRKNVHRMISLLALRSFK